MWTFYLTLYHHFYWAFIISFFLRILVWKACSGCEVSFGIAVIHCVSDVEVCQTSTMEARAEPDEALHRHIRLLCTAGFIGCIQVGVALARSLRLDRRLGLNTADGHEVTTIMPQRAAHIQHVLLERPLTSPILHTYSQPSRNTGPPHSVPERKASGEHVALPAPPSHFVNLYVRFRFDFSLPNLRACAARWDGVCA